MTDAPAYTFRAATVNDPDEGQAITYVFAEQPGQAPTTVCTCPGKAGERWAGRIVQGLQEIERRRALHRTRRERRAGVMPRGRIEQRTRR